MSGPRVAVEGRSPTLHLNQERQALVDTLREFGRRECGTPAQRDAATSGGRDSHSPALYGKLAELGFVGVSVPEVYGGAGGSVVDACLLMEETAYAPIPVSGLGVTLIVGAAVDTFGTPAQKERVLPRICAGEVQSIAMSEPGSGSDVGSLATVAERTVAGWVLRGQKTWITAAHHAEQILVVARSERDAAKHDGLSMFLVPAAAPGVQVRPIPTMGRHEVSDVFLTDVEVSAQALLGEVGQGWRQLMRGLNFERLIAATAAVGMARRAFDDTLRYVGDRRQFGRPVGSFQTLKHRLADLATDIECARLLAYDVAHRVEADPGELFARQVSMAKLKASETARRATLEGMQMMGGNGYASEYGMEEQVRAALPTTIYAGTSEIQREIIGSSYGL